MQFGSSLNWIVTGGSNFWPDQAQNYITKSTVTLPNTAATPSKTGSQSEGDSIFYLKHLAIHMSDSEFELTCLNPADIAKPQHATITLQ